MPRLAEMTTVTDDMIARAVHWYEEQAQKPPACFQGLHPLVLRRAAQLSAGDWRRVVRDDDALVVHNHPVW